MKAALHRIGNSQGVILPKPILAQIGLTEGELEMSVERDAIVLRKPPKHERAGWAEAAKKRATANDNLLAWTEFSNEDDAALQW